MTDYTTFPPSRTELDNLYAILGKRFVKDRLLTEDDFHLLYGLLYASAAEIQSLQARLEQLETQRLAEQDQVAGQLTATTAALAAQSATLEQHAQRLNSLETPPTAVPEPQAEPESVAAPSPAASEPPSPLRRLIGSLSGLTGGGNG